LRAVAGEWGANRNAVARQAESIKAASSAASYR
jgi:hypothetical protein